MLDKFGDFIKNLAYSAADSVPIPIQFVVAFVFCPIYWAGFIHLATCMAIIGVFIPFFVVSGLTGSVRLGIVATILAPALDFALLIFGMAWGDKDKSRDIVVWVVYAWIAIIGLAFFGWLLHPIFT